MSLTRTQLKATCYHEAGHVVVSRVLGGRVAEVSVYPDGSRHGMPAIAVPGHWPPSVQSLDDNLVITFAGTEAEYTLRLGRTPTRDDMLAADDGDLSLCANYIHVLENEAARGTPFTRRPTGGRARSCSTTVARLKKLRVR